MTKAKVHYGRGGVNHRSITERDSTHLQNSERHPDAEYQQLPYRQAPRAIRVCVPACMPAQIVVVVVVVVVHAHDDVVELHGE